MPPAERSSCGRTLPSRIGLGAIAWLGIGLMLACAVRTRSLRLEPHLPVPAPGEVARPDLRIGVGPFRDLRSSLSRELQRPPLELIWLGLRRRGENSTGDHSFRGDLPDGVRRDAARTLRYAQLFGEVRLVDSEEVPEDLDFVLVAGIEELVGFQYQSTQLGLLGSPGLRSRLDDPIGTARIRYELRSPRGVFWSERIEVRLQTEGLSMEQMALDAVAATQERMAIALGKKLLPVRDTRETRSVPLRVLDACGLGAKDARRLIDDMNEIFEREVGLSFEANVESWLAPQGARSDALLEAASREAPPQDGLVLALAPIDRARGLSSVTEPNRSGLARQLGRHALVVCTTVAPRGVTLAHEVAHLFGAVHTRDRGSIMYPVADFDARFFDAVNRRILRVTRDRPLGGPLPDPLVARLREVYSEARIERQRVDVESIETALRVLD